MFCSMHACKIMSIFITTILKSYLGVYIKTNVPREVEEGKHYITQFWMQTLYEKKKIKKIPACGMNRWPKTIIVANVYEGSPGAEQMRLSFSVPDTTKTITQKLIKYLNYQLIINRARNFIQFLAWNQQFFELSTYFSHQYCFNKILNLSENC